MHITLRTSVGNLRQRDIKTWLDSYLPSTARQNGIRLFHFAVVDNHLHLALLAPSRSALNAFFRSITGVIARRVLRAQKGQAKGVKFWDGRPYSRILTWGRELQNVIAYIERNSLEASGQITYVKRDRKMLPGLKRAIEENLVLAQFDSLSRQIPMNF